MKIGRLIDISAKFIFVILLLIQNLFLIGNFIGREHILSFIRRSKRCVFYFYSWIGRIQFETIILEN
uniref:Uncharacterized protein n=1 Tax=Leptospira ellisii TaxID=2023197 RepID=A0A2N0B635_9LEPT|nr:hypothetical protein CH379_15480 [Leptospira ellisii]